MSKAHLAGCPACARHVRVDEASCPFCGTSLPEAFHVRPVPRAPPGRLSRAALYALGAAGTVSASIACGSTPTPSPPYGAPPPFDSGIEHKDSGSTPFDSGQPIYDAAYGGPTFDSGEPGDATTRDTSSPEDSGPTLFDAAYGGPTFDSGEPDSMNGALYGGPIVDSGEPDTMNGGALYGGPPHVDP
jgi:hypothetical protein